MRATARLGSIFGISILVHYSWFVIFALVTVSMIGNYAQKFPQLSASVQAALGIFTSTFFFGSVLFHELAHSLVAIWKGIKVRSITLFIFGGVAEIEDEAQRPSTEILIAVAGPCASFLLAIVFGSVWLLTRGFVPVISYSAGWLATINFSLGIFNLLPGLPLDGGRILRGIAWSLTGSLSRATRLAGVSGRGLGYLVILSGIWLALARNRLGDGIWLFFIGWFLKTAAETNLFQAQISRVVAGIKAAQIMSRSAPCVPPGISLNEFVTSYLMQSTAQCFQVGESAQPRGLITLADVRAVPRAEWATTSVQAVMRPMERLDSVAPDAAVEEVWRLMNNKNITQVPVISEGHWLGIIGRDDLLNLIQNRLELAT